MSTDTPADDKTLAEAIARAGFMADNKMPWDDLHPDLDYVKERYLKTAWQTVAIIRAAGWQPGVTDAVAVQVAKLADMERELADKDHINPLDYYAAVSRSWTEAIKASGGSDVPQLRAELMEVAARVIVWIKEIDRGSRGTV